MIHIAPPGAIKFPMVCYGRKRGTDDGLLGEVSSFLEEICSSLEIVSFYFLEVVSACFGRVWSFLEDISSSICHCSSGKHYGLVAKPVFRQTTIHTNKEVTLYMYVFMLVSPKTSMLKKKYPPEKNKLSQAETTPRDR